MLWRWTVGVDKISAKRMNSIRRYDDVGRICFAIGKCNFCTVFRVFVLCYFNIELSFNLNGSLTKTFLGKHAFGFFSHSAQSSFMRVFLLATRKWSSKMVPFSSRLISNPVGLSFPAVILVLWTAWPAFFHTWLKFILSKHKVEPLIPIPAPIGLRIFVDFS